VSDVVEVQTVDGPVHASIRPPGSKSLTNRALVVAALAARASAHHSACRLSGVLDSDDTRVMIDSLRRLGWRIEQELQTCTVTLDGRDPAALEKNAFRFDMIISTVNVPLDWNAYVGTLKPKGRLHVVGAVLEPLGVVAFPLIAGQKAISGSPVGSPATIATMLDFAARHGIEPKTEHFAMQNVNDAMDHLREGKARYRIVLDRK